MSVFESIANITDKTLLKLLTSITNDKIYREQKSAKDKYKLTATQLQQQEQIIQLSATQAATKGMKRKLKKI